MIKELRTRGLLLRNIFVFFSINNYKNGNFSEKDLQLNYGDFYISYIISHEL